MDSGDIESAGYPLPGNGGPGGRCLWIHPTLADIDIDVPDEYLPPLAELLAGHVVFGPARYRDEEWDVMLLTVNFAGCDIDLGGASGANVFDRAAGKWMPLAADLKTAVRQKLLGVEVPVVAKEALVAYKRRIDREVDRLDIAAMEATSSTAS